MRLIDAEKLFDKVGNIKPKNKQHYEDIGTFMNMITNSPTIEPKVKVGHWIDRVVEECADYDAIRWRCSECGQLSCCNSKFCGDCGAKMVEPQESCEKCSYAEETDGNHCYECVKGESKFEPQKEEVNNAYSD